MEKFLTHISDILHVTPLSEIYIYQSKKALKMEALYSSKMLVTIYPLITHSIQVDFSRHQLCRENCKFVMNSTITI